MSFEDPPATPPATATTAQTDPAQPGTPLNLIDPKLKARALKRLQGILKGNGIKVEDVKIETCQALVYPFQARTFLKLNTKYGIRIEPGMNRTAELAVNNEAFHTALNTTVLQSRTEPPKRKSIVDYLFQRPDKGFGMKDQKVSFHTLTRDFVMHEGCITCSKLGKVQCNKCHATGMLGCSLCQGRKQITCPQCRGSGKTPGSNQAHSCIRCRGDGKIQCTQCHGRGQMKCNTCAASGTLKCQKCAGTGWLSHLAHVELEAMIHFDFEREALPVEVHKMVDAFGSRLVEKGDVEVILQRQPETQQEINDEIRAANEPHDMIFIDYNAKVPFGPIQFRLKDRVIPATLFGYHGKLIEAPSFLDDITRKGQQVLQEAANNTGDVAEKIKRAARYRLLNDVVALSAGKAKQRQALDILSNRYPTGIGADKLLNLLILADKALKNITRKPRAYGLAGGLIVFTLLAGFYFLFAGRLLLGAQGVPSPGLIASDIALIPLGTLIATTTAQLTASFAQKRALSSLHSKEMLTRAMPKIGKTLWWALGSTALIWSVLLTIAVFVPGFAAPEWAQQLLLKPQ